MRLDSPGAPLAARDLDLDLPEPGASSTPAWPNSVSTQQKSQLTCWLCHIAGHRRGFRALFDHALTSPCSTGCFPWHDALLSPPAPRLLHLHNFIIQTPSSP